MNRKIFHSSSNKVFGKWNVNRKFKNIKMPNFTQPKYFTHWPPSSRSSCQMIIAVPNILNKMTVGVKCYLALEARDETKLKCMAKKVEEIYRNQNVFDPKLQFKNLSFGTKSNLWFKVINMLLLVAQPFFVGSQHNSMIYTFKFTSVCITHSELIYFVGISTSIWALVNKRCLFHLQILK